jgi:hypothetical protein
MKVATTFEESKILLGIGVPRETADMYYRVVSYFPHEAHVGPAPLYDMDFQLREDDNIPAWSLNALLEIVSPVHLFHDQGDWHCLKRIENQDGRKGWQARTGATPIDAVYGIVVTLFTANKTSHEVIKKADDLKSLIDGAIESARNGQEEIKRFYLELDSRLKGMGGILNQIVDNE